LSIQAEVGTRPPATATPHGPAGRARRGDGSKVDRCARPVRTVAGPPRAGASPAWRSVGGRWRGARAPVPCAAPASVGRRAPSPLPLSGRATRSARARQGQGQRASRRGLPRGVSAGPAPPLPQGVARRTPTRAHGGRPAQQRGGELVEGRAQAHAHACCGTQRPPTLGRTLQAIGEGPPDPGRRRRRQGCAGTRALGCGTGAGPRGRAGAPRPEPPAAADGGPSPRLRPASAVRGIGQARDRARQGTPRHNGHQARRPQGPDSVREGQGREEGRGAPPGADCAHHGGPTGERGPRPAAACGSARQQAAGPCRPLGRWGLGGASGCARPGAPARQARGASGPPRAAAGRVAERKAEGEEAGEDARDKRVGGAQESHGGRRIVASDGERTVAACQCGSLSPGAPAGQLAVGAAESS